MLAESETETEEEEEEEETAAATRKLAHDLGLPPLAPFLTEGGEHDDDNDNDIYDDRRRNNNLRHLYLVPQTLYKLHPDFDLLLKGVLEAER